MNNNQQPIAFIIPSVGNKITTNDIKNKQIRITAAFKPLFPENYSELKIVVKNDHYLRYKNLGKRSHIIRFTDVAFDELEIKAGGMIKIEKYGPDTFKLTKHSA
jgi:hypothetical protein